MIIVIIITNDDNLEYNKNTKTKMLKSQESSTTIPKMDKW